MLFWKPLNGLWLRPQYSCVYSAIYFTPPHFIDLRRAKRGLEPRKPDLRFMVTFSDDEDQEMAYNTDIGSDSSNSQSGNPPLPKIF